MKLSKVAGGGSGIELAAGQTFSPIFGVGHVNITGVNINTTTNILALTGKYSIQSLTISGLGTTGNLVMTINIDGRVVYTGTVAITQDGLAVFGSASSANPTSHSKAPIKVKSSLTVTLQKASTTAALTGIIYAEA